MAALEGFNVIQLRNFRFDGTSHFITVTIKIRIGIGFKKMKLLTTILTSIIECVRDILPFVSLSNFI